MVVTARAQSDLIQRDTNEEGAAIIDEDVESLNCPCVLNDCHFCNAAIAYIGGFIARKMLKKPSVMFVKKLSSFPRLMQCQI